MSVKRFLSALVLLWPCLMICAADVEVSTVDTTVSRTKSYNPLRWIGRYFKESNKHSDRAFDFGLLIGPSYTAATSAGLGGMASGLYSWDRSDSTLQKSNVSLFGNASLKGMFVIGLKGNNYLPKDKYRLNYVLMFYTFPSTFWGVGYKNGSNDETKSDYGRIKIQFNPTFLFRVAENVYLGPVVDIEWLNSFDFDNDELLEGADKSVFSVGAGLDFTYDSRDFSLNASRGNYLKIEQMFFASGFGNDQAFSYTDVTYSAYRRVWKGCIAAMELHGMFNYGDVPWTMMASSGTGGRLRGYFEGRYRDKNIMEGQVELRQRVKKRHGIAIWGALGNVFPNFNHIYFDEILPNFGVGYRWEFKPRINIRLDLGFTKDSPNFVFNVNEAF